MHDPTGRYTFAYDAIISQARSASSPPDKTITYKFDPVGLRSRMIDPDGGRFTYGYAAAAQITELINPQEHHTSYSNDNGGCRAGEPYLLLRVRVKNL